MINTEQWLDAAENGDLETIKKAVAEGFDINTADKYWHSTAVREASINNQAEVLSFLLEQGANCHGIQVDGRTLLGWCAEHGLFEIVKLLVEKGNIDVNEDLKLRHFALDNALQNNQFEIAYYLAEHHAKLRNPRFSLQYVANDQDWEFFVKDVELTQDVVNDIMLGLTTEIGTKYCSLAHYQFVVKYFTDHQDNGNFKVDLKNCGKNLFSNAVCKFFYRSRRNMPELGRFLSYLADCGVDINEADERGMSPFLYAIEAKDRFSARYLKKLGANVLQLTKDGQSALHIAAHKEDLSMVQFLVEECDLDINAQDKKGLTPAHLAAEHNAEIRILEYLVDEMGADLSICSCIGKVPGEGSKKRKFQWFFGVGTPRF
jgi:ankyrin repeat protein